MSTHRGAQIRVSKRNKKVLIDIKDFLDFDSMDDSITFLTLTAVPMPKDKKKRRFDPFSI